MRRILLVNRVLWGVLLLAMAGAAGWAGLEFARMNVPGDPLDVPRLEIAQLPAERSLAEPPARNPFDPAGTPWTIAAAPQAKPRGGTLQGVIILPGKRGVMTSNGFVAAGEDFDGGKLRRVELDRVVIRDPSGDRTVPIGEDHAKMLADWFPGRDKGEQRKDVKR